VCIVVVLALTLFPLGGWVIGYLQSGVTGGWIGAALGLVLAIVLAGAPTAAFLKFEKKKYDRENRDPEA
jgi:hypothetical protein